jgi:hypothetical protein
MKAYLETTFKKGFLLTEETLIKIDDIIRRRLFPDDQLQTLKYKVFRVDGMLLELDTPAELIAEENSSRNAISRLEIESSGAHKIHLIFDPKQFVDLEIESDDRDLAYLLFSDVKEYLNSEVLKFRAFSFDSILSSKGILPGILMLFMGAVTFAAGMNPTSDDVSKVLATDNLQQKLNFIIENRQEASYSKVKYPMLIFMGVLFSLFFIGPFLDKVFPRNLFCWGKAEAAHRRLVSIREKWIWGVVIAFVISILSTIVMDQFKKV